MLKTVLASLAGAFFFCALASPSKAQTAVPIVVATCGTATMVAGGGGSPTVDVHGNSCTNGTGGGGGAITIANGADVAEGSTTDAVCTLPASATACTVVALLKAIGNAVSSAIPAGTAIIGKVGIDQTTPGTTNGVFVTNTSTSPPAGFTPNGNYASLAVTGTTGNVALPSGTSVAVANTGSQTAFVNFGASGAVTATTSNVPIAGGQTIAFTVGSNTFIAGITSNLTTNLTLVGGTGAYSGTGGSVTLNAPANDVSAGPQNFTGSGTLTVSSQGSGSVGMVISGTFTGAAYTIQGSVDGTNYAAIPFYNNSAGGTIFVAQPTATAVGTYVAPASGYKSVRLNVTAVSTGTLVASLNASAGSAQRPTGTQGDNSNISGINGTTPSTGNGTSGAGDLRVNLASDNSAVSGLGAVATGAAPPANAIYQGANASGATGGLVAGLISCDAHVFKHITSATDTLAVQGVASQTIRICGWRSRAAGVATWFLENTASANANCSSSNTQITGVATEAANTGETMLAPFWTGTKNTSGNGLCINSTGTGGVDVDVWYTQF